MQNAAALPKVDLHVHLEGSLTDRTIRELTSKHKIVYSPTKSTRPYTDFFHNFRNLMSLLKEPEDYYLATLDFLGSQASFGVIYSEFYISISSYLHTNHLVERVFENIEKAIHEAEKKLSVYSNIIVDINRASHWDPNGEIVVDYALANRSKHVVAIGLGGDEKYKPPHLFSKVFNTAKDGGLGCVAHAGETGNSTSVISAINNLGVTRIGHGIQAIRSKEATGLLKAKQVLVEICPVSESLTGATTSVSTNPILKYLELGIPISIGTDDQHLFNTNPAFEMEKTLEAFPRIERYLPKILLDSINYSFASPETKELLKQRIQTVS